MDSSYKTFDNPPDEDAGDGAAVKQGKQLGASELLQFTFTVIT